MIFGEGCSAKLAHTRRDRSGLPNPYRTQPTPTSVGLRRPRLPLLVGPSVRRHVGQVGLHPNHQSVALTASGREPHVYGNVDAALGTLLVHHTGRGHGRPLAPTLRGYAGSAGESTTGTGYARHPYAARQGWFAGAAFPPGSAAGVYAVGFEGRFLAIAFRRALR